FQNGGDATGMAFNVDDLNELKGLIYGNGNIFMDVEKKLSYAGYDSTLDVLEKMATMPTHICLPVGRVNIKQTDCGVTFSLVNKFKENEMGCYFDQTRSIEYLDALSKNKPNAFSHFNSITGLDKTETVKYISACVNSDDLTIMTGLLLNDGEYDFIRMFNSPSNVSSGCAYLFAEYTSTVLGDSFENESKKKRICEYNKCCN
ncbi:hypothetical protein SAMN02910370_02876, partial [Lachnospiraceae bacterium XPB1003]